MASSLTALSEQIAATVERVAASVVAVHARSRFNSSGVHWSPGVVVTADHTIRRDDEIRINGAGEGGPATELRATLAGRDPGTDLAVLRVEGLSQPVAARATSEVLKPGHLVLAVGRNGESPNAAIGVVSSLSGPSQTWRGGHLDQVIRLDLTLHPVAAGGAVVDAAGQLIGIATPVLSRVSVFAVPLATVDRAVATILAHGRVPRGYLGAGLQPVALPEHLTSSSGPAASSGLIVVSVDPQAPAGKAGILIGDILLELNGRGAGSIEDVRAILDSDSIGKTFKGRVLRGGNVAPVEITIGERPGR